MWRKRVVIGIAAVVFGVITLAAMLWLTKSDRHINPDGFAKITTGMTEAEVANVFGAPAGNHADPSVIALLPRQRWGLESDDYRGWLGNEWGIVVFFEDGLVVGARTLKSHRRETPAVQRFREWLGLSR
jgi:hypothetical protein